MILQWSVSDPNLPFKIKKKHLVVKATYQPPSQVLYYAFFRFNAYITQHIYVNFKKIPSSYMFLALNRRPPGPTWIVRWDHTMSLGFVGVLLILSNSCH
ncbi:hypothetical protein HanPI659440_Chr11g0439491 [Helianthus annuus]|nr:hypothetical protein HanPI659440_Chr11g0439491 [Helianthus annuus]